MPVQGAVLGESGVGVGVEMDEGDLAETVHPGHPECVGPCDRVVPAEDDRHFPGGGHLLDGVGDPSDGDLQLTRSDVDVPHVDHSQCLEWVETGGKVGPVTVHCPVVGVADRLGPEACPGPIGRAPVERGAEDDHRPVPEIVHRDRGDAEERVP